MSRASCQASEAVLANADNLSRCLSENANTPSLLKSHQLPTSRIETAPEQKHTSN